MKTSCFETWLWTAVVWTAICGPVSAHGPSPKETPVTRLVEYFSRRLKETPNDARLHYLLGRTHGLALELKSQTLFVWERGEDKHELADRSWNRLEFSVKELTSKKNEAEPAVDELRAHLREAIRHLNRSIELDPGAARVHLALASVLEAGMPLAEGIDIFPRCPVPGAEVSGGIQEATDQIGSSPKAVERLRRSVQGSSSRHSWDGSPSERDRVVSHLYPLLSDPDPKVAKSVRLVLLEDWKEEIAEQYFIAFSQALPGDTRVAEKPIWGSMESWVSYEAVKGYLAAVKARGARDDDTVRLQTAEAALKAFDALPRPNGITPIIFAPSEETSLASCWSRETRVCFDLDGSGRDSEWPWVRPDVGILVWDPERTGRIASGRQLFGSVTWWTFFADGYEALRALDDDDDGELSNAELSGLGVWFDRNVDGVSDPGEVCTAEDYGIERIAARSTSSSAACPINPAGLTLRHGRVLPTYDWIPDSEPISEP